MPRTEITNLSDDARVWIFGISPALTDASRQDTLLRAVDSFLANWTAHNHPISSARELRDGSFLVIAVEKTAETSGCSIDRLFGTLRQMETEFGVSILDAGRVFFRHGDGRIDAMTRPEFRERGDIHTVVFDTTVDTLGRIRTGAWEGPAAKSWHRELLRKAG
jgi:hypothetical protein